jgi:hypothetical protein
LLEYQLVDRDLLVWAITKTKATHAAQQHPTGEIARLAQAVQRGCANGNAGAEADQLATILVEPIASEVDGYRRVIVIPYGPLNGLPFRRSRLAAALVTSTSCRTCRRRPWCR